MTFARPLAKLGCQDPRGCEPQEDTAFGRLAWYTWITVGVSEHPSDTVKCEQLSEKRLRLISDFFGGVEDRLLVKD